MRVFISYSTKDKSEVTKIVNRLEKDGHEIWIDSLRLKPGDNFMHKIEEGLKECDAYIVVISNNSLGSDWVRREFSFIALQQISKREQRIIPIRIEKCPVPGYLAERLYIDLSEDFEAGLETLSRTLKESTRKEISTPANRSISSLSNQENHISHLHEALRKGRLTLMCGAGVSVGAGIPVWSDLLLSLLERVMEKISHNNRIKLDEKAASEFQKRYGASSLILGKYLKNNLGKDFSKEVRSALYLKEPTNCDIIESIIELSRPHRDAKALDSIITFNFDSLIEEQLTQNRIANRPIFSESISHDSDELPIYHVHGYLPRNGKISESSDLVFSEDAYHSQFIDPFSWSNLIQLSKLTQNTCLFVGISLTDPNMRRLLDVAWRKNPDRNIGHYILKKIPKVKEGDVLDEVTRLLEEQDANALGLKVIWTESFEEVPNILKKIVRP